MSVPLPQVVADRYRLIAPLGQGGMGRVWRAADEVLHREVAIKELVPPPGLTVEERQEMRERSLREARAIARLNNINVVRVFDVLRTHADPWIVMEYVPSRSLQDVLATDGPVTPTRAAEIGLGVLNALRAAHRAGVVHRDVKPGNVLLGEDGRVVLTDFGLATVPGDPNVTRTGLVLGSPAYIAPERARDGSAGPAGDLWSLGATLFAAVEGQSPYARPSAIGTLSALATEPPPPARHAGPLKAVLNGLLRKDPAQRISAVEAERLLNRAAGRRPRVNLAMNPTIRRPGLGRQRELFTPVVPGPRPSEQPPAPPAGPPRGTVFTPGKASVPITPTPPAPARGTASVRTGPTGRIDTPTRVDGSPAVDTPTRVDGAPVVDTPTRVDGTPVAGSPARVDQSVGAGTAESDASSGSTGTDSADAADAVRVDASATTTSEPDAPVRGDQQDDDAADPGTDHRALAAGAAAVSSRPEVAPSSEPASAVDVPAPDVAGPTDATEAAAAGDASPGSRTSPRSQRSPGSRTSPVEASPEGDAPRAGGTAPDADVSDEPAGADASTADGPSSQVSARSTDRTEADAAVAGARSPAVSEPPAATGATDAGLAADDSAAAGTRVADTPRAADNSDADNSDADNSDADNSPDTGTAAPVGAAASVGATVPAGTAASLGTAALGAAVTDSDATRSKAASPEAPSSDVTHSDPTHSDPTHSDPTHSDATRYDATSSEAATSADATSADAANAEATSSEATSAEVTSVDGTRSDAVRSDVARPDTTGPESTHGEAGAEADASIAPAPGAAGPAGQSAAPPDTSAQAPATGIGAAGVTRPSGGKSKKHKNKAARAAAARNAAAKGLAAGAAAAGSGPAISTGPPAGPAAAKVATGPVAANRSGGLETPAKRSTPSGPTGPQRNPGRPPVGAGSGAGAASRPAAGVAAVVVRATSADRRRLWLVGALVAGVLLALAVFIPVALRDDAPRDRSGPQTGGTPAATSDRTTDAVPPGGQGAAPGGEAPGNNAPGGGAPSGDATPSAAPPASPTPVAPATPAVAPLPAGWRMHKDPTGFEVPVPKGWQVSRERTRVYFQEPDNGRRLLMIDQTRQPKSNPVKDWQGQERQRLNDGRYANYRRIKIVAVDFWDKAADWEWIYTNNGARLHVVNRGFVTAKDQAYAIYWSTPDSQWRDSQDEFQLIASRFKPARS